MGEEQPKKFAQISRESVKTYAESVGISDLSEDAAAMLAEDVCYRLRQAAQASSQYMKHSKRRKMTSEDFNRALKWMDVEPIYGYGSQDPMLFRATKDAELFFMEDKEISLPEISMDGKIPVCAGKTTVRAQWLAVEGVQKPPIQSGPQGITGKRNGQVQAQTLSEDLVKYHEHVTKAILGSDEDIMKVALDDLRTNSKVASLLPYLIQFVSVGVKKVSHDLGQLTKLMHIVMSIVYNPVVYLGPYLKQLVSSVMYCITEPLAASINPLNDHWTLRDYAARLLAHVCKTYNSSVNHLKNQLYVAFQEVILDPARPLCSHYGAIVGLMALGPKAIEEVLLPQLSSYWPTLVVVLEDTSLSNIQVKTDAHKVYGAILLAANKMLKSKQKEQLSTELHSASSSPSQSPAQEPTEFAFGTASHLLHLGESSSSLSNADKIRHVRKSVMEWYTELYEYFGDCLSLQLDTVATCNHVYEPKLTSLADINNATACNEQDSRYKGEVAMGDGDRLPRSRELRALQDSAFMILGQRRGSHSPKSRTRSMRHRSRSTRGTSISVKDAFTLPKNFRSMRVHKPQFLFKGFTVRTSVTSKRSYSKQKSIEASSSSVIPILMKPYGKIMKKMPITYNIAVARKLPPLNSIL